MAALSSNRTVVSYSTLDDIRADTLHAPPIDPDSRRPPANNADKVANWCPSMGPVSAAA